MRSSWPGAPHATDIPFVFDTVAAKYGAALTAADAAMAELAIGYWSAFAKTGNPNGDSRPIWPAYDAAKDQILDFANSGAVAKPDPWRARLDLAEYANESEHP